jgi:histidine ammonia-lyase
MVSAVKQLAAIQERSVIVLDGTSLTCADVAAVGRRLAGVAIGAAGSDRASAAAETARALTATRGVYGRTTGVGANRKIEVEDDDARAHGLRLVRSHASGSGPLLTPELGLAMLAVRANQIAAGGSGVDAGVLAVLADCVNRGLRPPARVYGGIGTGDLAALATAALCLLGERDWLPSDTGDGPAEDGSQQPRFALDPADGLAFISSNAATLGEAAIACHDLSVFLRAGIVIAALSHLAARSSAEPYAEPVQLARGHPGQLRVARDLRELLAAETGVPARIQDPYSYRALPQVHGPALDALENAELVVTRELNAAAENPLIDVPGQRVWHNANFHAAYVALAMDAARLAVFQTAALSAARIGTLMDDRCTGLTTFLAMDTPPSSGLMIVEYAAHSAVADIRQLAAPVVLGGAVLSVGAEEHASFGTQAARSATGVVQAYRAVLACELVAAVRALRLRPARPGGARLALAFDRADAALPDAAADRPLDDDLAIAEQLLPAMAAALGTTD